MKKSILNLGKALNKIEQKEINGGTDDVFTSPKCLKAKDKTTCDNMGCFWGMTPKGNWYCTQPLGF